MKFQLAINLERMDGGAEMHEVAKHTLEMVQMAEQGGFNIVWAAEHHALEMTIAPNPFQILTWWAQHTGRIRLGTAVAVAADDATVGDNHVRPGVSPFQDALRLKLSVLVGRSLGCFYQR